MAFNLVDNPTDGVSGVVHLPTRDVGWNGTDPKKLYHNVSKTPLTILVPAIVNKVRLGASDSPPPERIYINFAPLPKSRVAGLLAFIGSLAKPPGKHHCLRREIC